MNIPYKSVYDEAISDRVLQKVGKSKFKTLGNAPSKLKDYELEIIEQLEDSITNIRTTLLKLLSASRKEFKNLEKNVLKLKLKDKQYYKPFKQSLFANGISSSYSDNLAEVKFPGNFGKIIEQIKVKVNELQDIFESGHYISYSNKLQKNLRDENEIWKSLNLDNTSEWKERGIRETIKLGITPADVGGFYRLHATNSPPDAFKSSTGGIGLGKYLYLAVVHHCGHGYTTGSSDDSLKVWNHVVKKRKDIYSFMAEEIGEKTVLAISVLLPKTSVLIILNKFINDYSSGLDNEYKSFFGWLKYRNKNFGDTPIDLLDDGLYELFKPEIEKLDFSVPVVQNTNVSSNTNTPSDVSNTMNAREIVDISNLEWKKQETQEMSWYDAVSNIPKGYRLPTIQELNTAIQNNVEGFKTDEYWSSTTHSQSNNFGLYVSNGLVSKEILVSGKSSAKIVRYVKQVSNRNTLDYIPRSDPSDTATRENSLKIIDISNLEWKNEEQYEKNWYQAVDDTPNGYRLPTVQELHSSIKNGITGFRRDDYWSSTTYLINSDYGFYVYNSSSQIDVDIADKRAYPKRVRYVKEISNSNTNTSNTNFITTTQEAMKIVSVSSLFGREVEDKYYTWQEAKNLEKNNWRLPTVQELYSIYKEDEFISDDVFWTSSEKDKNRVWVIRFSDGIVGSVSKLADAKIYWVRDGRTF